MIKSFSFSRHQTAHPRCSLSEIKVRGWPVSAAESVSLHWSARPQSPRRAPAANCAVLTAAAAAQLKGAGVQGGLLPVGEGHEPPAAFRVRSRWRRSLRCPLLVGRRALWHSIHSDESQSKAKAIFIGEMWGWFSAAAPHGWRPILGQSMTW